ncbi:sugar transferase [Candidatus Roseilinea sp. NK_OTU-006]|jgi:exopolysaccharide biosynthesis polyprenyl glycosylphosphotransferase|uniref:sugar transferase n=1 Tax=Candidatus Roseilinea sp. NK_OTU-006 TaxID=2704250 RepID=UPI00145CE3E3|nr:sugar transferase [Candidatus Roseilinea sp. NK_OTU-006]
MSIPIKTNRVLIAIGLDLALTLMSLWLSAQIRLWLPFGQDLNAPNVALGWPVYALAVLIWGIVLAQFNLYSRRRARFREESRALTLAVLTALLILAGALYLSFRQVSRLQFIYFGVINIALLNAAHGIRFLRRRSGAARDAWRVLIVGATGIGRELAERIMAGAPGEALVIGFLDDHLPKHTQVCAGAPVLGRIDDAPRVAVEAGASEVILALPRDAQARLLTLIAQMEALPIQVSLTPDVLDLAWFMTRVEDLNGIPLLRLRESPLDGPARAVKRVMDIALSALGLALAGPLMALIALLIKLDSPGPALIRQQRVGENGRLFEMLKFRTMRADAQHNAEHSLPHKRRDDPRVTRLGRFLRRYSLDELPQLINVLKGEMSLVGPRPELPWLVDRYESWQRRRFAVPPGMTGWWQINGRSDRPMHLHVEDDLYYIRHYSLWLDVLILLKTVPAVLSGRGAF